MNSLKTPGFNGHSIQQTPGFNGYSIAFSPFSGQLAVASAQHYGIVGNGRLWILGDQVYDTQDGLFDVAWSECHESQLVTCSGDGSIKLWDLAVKDSPVGHWCEHTKEVYSVHWNLVSKSTFLSGSWDLTIKLWDPNSNRSLGTWSEHASCIYATIWSPHRPDNFASVSGDHTLKTWDVRLPKSTLTLPAHNAEILALDWCKYTPDTLVTGSVDTTIKVWDLRHPMRPLTVLTGHQYAVRRLKCSPHHRDMIGSCSYDMTCRLWDIQKGLLRTMDAHSEFVFGLDFSLFEQTIATCAWDESVRVFPL